jgi:hypothetical protein
MKKYFILLGMVALMIVGMNAQLLTIKQDNIISGSDLQFDAVFYLHLTITSAHIPDTLNMGIHLAPTDSIRAYGDYSAQLRCRSKAYNVSAGFFDARDQGNKTGIAVSSYAIVDTVRLDTMAAVQGFHCWFNIKFWGPGSDSVSRYDVFLKRDGSSKLDTIVIGAGFRNNPKPASLKIWSLMAFENKNPNLDATNANIVDNVGDIPGTGVENINLSPTKFALGQNYPNPFNPETRIQFGLPERGYVRLNVYNMLGQVVSVLVNGELPAGTKEVVWNGMDQNGRSVTSGVYFYKLETPQGAMTKKMTLVK